MEWSLESINIHQWSWWIQSRYLLYNMVIIVTVNCFTHKKNSESVGRKSADKMLGEQAWGLEFGYSAPEKKKEPGNLGGDQLLKVRAYVSLTLLPAHWTLLLLLGCFTQHWYEIHNKDVSFKPHHLCWQVSLNSLCTWTRSSAQEVGALWLQLAVTVSRLYFSFFL